MSTATEAPLPVALLLDASDAGLLLSFPEPVVLSYDLRVCVSLPASDGALHVLARVVRVERGADFHTYVGIAVEPAMTGPHVAAGPAVGGDEVRRWREWLAAVRIDRGDGDDDRHRVDGRLSPKGH